jgi:hypothetical protein
MFGLVVRKYYIRLLIGVCQDVGDRDVPKGGLDLGRRWRISVAVLSRLTIRRRA